MFKYNSFGTLRGRFLEVFRPPYLPKATFPKVKAMTKKYQGPWISKTVKIQANSSYRSDGRAANGGFGFGAEVSNQS